MQFWSSVWAFCYIKFLPCSQCTHSKSLRRRKWKNNSAVFFFFFFSPIIPEQLILLFSLLQLLLQGQHLPFLPSNFGKYLLILLCRPFIGTKKTSFTKHWDSKKSVEIIKLVDTWLYSWSLSILFVWQSIRDVNLNFPPKQRWSYH